MKAKGLGTRLAVQDVRECGGSSCSDAVRWRLRCRCGHGEGGLLAASSLPKTRAGVVRSLRFASISIVLAHASYAASWSVWLVPRCFCVRSRYVPYLSAVDSCERFVGDGDGLRGSATPFASVLGVGYLSPLQNEEPSPCLVYRRTLLIWGVSLGVRPFSGIRWWSLPCPFVPTHVCIA